MGLSNSKLRGFFLFFRKKLFSSIIMSFFILKEQNMTLDIETTDVV